MVDFVVSARNVLGQTNRFGAEPGKPSYLKVPGNRYPKPGGSQMTARGKWVDDLIDEARTGEIRNGQPLGDILVFIHGYNNSQKVVMQRHRKLNSDLKKLGYKGAFVSFDWPSADSTLNYLEDRDDAKATARYLRDGCIRLFKIQQERGCIINVHLLGHSTGAYVIRQAFADADEVSGIKNYPWVVSQVALIGADVSARSMSESDSKSRSLYRHCRRLTNYQNPFDHVLKLSNVKRIGLAPRVGRVGLPDDAHEKAVNVDCGDYFSSKPKKKLARGQDYYGTFEHSWHIGDRLFAADLLHTINGDIDRHRIPTRKLVDGQLVLKN